ncbi:MAG: DUF1295 domain-containing protein [Promethearchaeota archaeon]|nr:MAG: DUF1295 domain-containing protein [Candidatus Lokiarchaeota archaeon]
MLFWIIRILFIGMLIIYDLMYIYFLKKRKRYELFLENFYINLGLIILYNALCLIPAILPSLLYIIPKSWIGSNMIISLWYFSVGIILIIIGVMVMALSLKMRRVIGAQDTSGKLLTSGVYSFSRHPIYFSISILSLGLALSFNNLNALIIIPIIILLNFLTGKIEEKYDMDERFKNQYSHYKEKTRALGPFWFWLILVLAIGIPFLFLLFNL